MKGQVSLGVTAVGMQRPIPPEVQARIAGEKITEIVKLAPTSAAKALGVSFPAHPLGRADDVIE